MAKDVDKCHSSPLAGKTPSFTGNYLFNHPGGRITINAFPLRASFNGQENFLPLNFFTMKPLINIMTAKWLAPFALFLLVFVSCQKEKGDVAAIERTKPVDQRLNGHLTQTKTFSSNVIIRWLNMQLDMLRVPLAAGTGSQASDRVQAYCGIATYEAVVPGMPAYQSLTGQLTGFPEMPEAEPGEAYHWAASANAALAEMNRRLFPTTSQQNKTNMNNLENELQAIYATEVDNATLLRSIAFGKEVALRVFTWATTDGSANINPPYVPPGGPGLWN